METLLAVRHLTRKGDYMFTSDLQRVLRTWQQPHGSRLLNRQRPRTSLQTSGATYGLVPIPALFLQNDADIHKLPAQPGPRAPYRAESQLHEDLTQTNALARRPDSTLRRRLSTLRVSRGKRTHLTPQPGQVARSARSPPPPHQGFLDTSASRAPPGYRHRHNVTILLRAGAKTNQDCAASQTPHR
jgi:hypothetical protein